MEKISFLARVAEVMKGMISYDTMMAAIRRSCMRPEQENLELMEKEEERLNRLIEGTTTVAMLDLPDDVIDALVLRYLKNSQFLAAIPEEDVDVSGLDGDLAYWKKTMLHKAP